MKLPDSRRVVEIIKASAKEAILPRFRRLATEDISEKSPGDLVTIADVDCERRLETALMKLAPGSLCVGEEAAEGNPDVIKLLNGKHPVWVIDPLDGTRNFAHGRTPFVVIVAYCLGGETLMGWIYNPLTGKMVWAAEGQGAWNSDGDRLLTASSIKVSGMRGSLSKAAAGKMRTRINSPQDISRVGCVGQDYMDLSTGVLHFARYTAALKPWDHAAGVLIHRQAGGYDRLVRSGRPYMPDLDPEQVRKTNEVLMLAPNVESWLKLATMTGDLLSKDLKQNKLNP